MVSLCVHPLYGQHWLLLSHTLTCTQTDLQLPGQKPINTKNKNREWSYTMITSLHDFHLEKKKNSLSSQENGEPWSLMLTNSIQGTYCMVQLKLEELIKAIFIINKNSDIWFWENIINYASSFPEKEKESDWCQLYSCINRMTEMPLTFLVCEQSTQAEDIAYNHIGEFRKNGVLHRKGDIVCNSTVFCIPDFKQGQAYVYSPDYKCVVCGSFPNLYKVISTYKQKKVVFFFF